MKPPRPREHDVSRPTERNPEAPHREESTLPSLLATRITFGLAAPLTVLVTVIDLPIAPAALGTYWLSTLVLGVASFWRGLSDRVRSVVISSTWTLSGIGTLFSQGLVSGPPILLAAISIVGLLFGRRPALVLTLLSAFCFALAAVGFLSGSLPVPSNHDTVEDWVSHSLTFLAIAGMTSVVQAAVLKRATSARLRAQMFALAAERSDSGVIITGLDRKIIWVNEAFTRQTGYEPEDAVGASPGALLQGPATSKADVLDMRQALDQFRGVTREVINYTRDGVPFWIRLEIKPILASQDDALLGFTAVQTVITDDKVRGELEDVERAIALSLPSAGDAKEALRQLSRALCLSSCAIGVNIFDEQVGEPSVLIATTSATCERFDDELIETLMRELGPCGEGPAHTTIALETHGLAHQHLWFRSASMGIHVGVVVVSDTPGVHQLSARVPQLLAMVETHLVKRAEAMRFEALFAHFPEALALCDEDGRVQQSNRHLAQLWPSLRLGEPLADHIPAVRQLMSEARGGPLGNHYTSAWREDSEGESRGRDIEFNVAPLPLQRQTGTIVALRDVTVRRDEERAQQRLLADLQRSLDEREVLLKEVHHRVKNNLQIVSSLLNMQADRASTEETRTTLYESTHRVRSMALVHQMLYGGVDLSRVDLARYAEQLTQELCIALAPTAQVRLELNEAIVAVEQAIPCGLILNELVTNSLKHGKSADGLCHLRVRTQSSPEGIWLEVADRGPGLPPDFLARRKLSLGFQVIEALLRQLGATLGTESSSGACLRLTLPAEPRR